MSSLNAVKRALVSSVITLFLCFTMLLGTTYAWFTDSVTSGRNKIVAGTLDVALYQWTAADESGRINISDSGAPVFTDAVRWEPGKTEVVYLSIRNNGTLALQYKVALDVTAVSAPGLTDVLRYTITQGERYQETASIVGNGTPMAFGLNETPVKEVELLPGDEHFLALSVHMIEEMSEAYMGGSVTFDIRVQASQMVYEEDGFDKVYDKDASAYPLLSVKVLLDNSVESTLNTGDSVRVKIPAGAPIGSYMLRLHSKTLAVNKQTGEARLAADLTLEKNGNKITADNSTEYMVELDIGANKALTVVRQNGMDVDAAKYSYDAKTGILMIHTTSFGLFSVEYTDIANS